MLELVQLDPSHVVMQLRAADAPLIGDGLERRATRARNQLAQTLVMAPDYSYYGREDEPPHHASTRLQLQPMPLNTQDHLLQEDSARRDHLISLQSFVIKKTVDGGAAARPSA